MSLESKVAYELNKHPGMKKVVKRIYQRGMYAISPKIKSTGDIVRVSPDDGKEYFFGYYDKSPWDATGRYMLCLRANNTWEDVSPKEKADILLIDTQKDNAFVKLAETGAWNVQQACMLQWLGPDFSSGIIYNDFRDGKYVSVIKDIKTDAEKVINAAVYAVAQDGKTALTLDFSRLYNLRPGYGYYNVPESTKGIALPDTTAIWRVDLESGDVKPLLKYTDFAAFSPREEMKLPGTVHKVNHLMISPNGKRFMVLYRWFVGQRKYTRLITCNMDGTDMYLLSDDDSVSHCCWKNDDEILAFENKKSGGRGYYLMRDKTGNYQRLWPKIGNDGHPSYSPDGKFIVIDSYPNRARVASVKVMNEQTGIPLASVFAPFKYDNETRCDLHPRWSRDGKEICFDSVFEGHRGLYTVRVPRNFQAVREEEKMASDNKLVSCIIPTYKRSDSLKNAVISALNQTYRDIEVLVVDDNEPGDEYSVRVANLIPEFKDERVKLVTQPKHINGAEARNAGIRASKGKFIAFLDDDDIWDKEKIQKQVDYLNANPDVDGVSTYYRHYRNDKLVRSCPAYTCENIHKKIIGREVAVFTSTVLLKKDALLAAGLFDVSLRRHQDLQLLLDFTYAHKLDVIPEYLVKLTMEQEHDRLGTERFIELKEKFFTVCDKHLKRYSAREQKEIKNAHYFEVVHSALKHKKIPIAIKYALKIGLNLTSWKNVLQRAKGRRK